jgi:cGMP-dependent protein kinase 1
MAPEIVIGKGYNNMVDLWSLGVCLYEFLCGILPFGDASESAYEIYEEIMQTELRFPEFLHDKKAKKLIEQLLSHNPPQRHGGGFENLKKHVWFDDFRWEGLVRRDRSALRPPKVPDLRDKAEPKLDIPLIELIKRLENEKKSHEYHEKWASFDRIL